jgi:hypothetical protein
VRRISRKFDRKTVRAKKKRWIEKTPNHVHQIGKIFELWPKAKVLLIVRDGRDVACSHQDRGFSIEDGIERWVGDNLASREFWDHPQVYMFKYEDLIRDFRSTIEGILIFLGEEYEVDVERYHENEIRYYSEEIEKPPSAHEKYHRQYRNWQINQPLFDGRGKWERLSDEELCLIYSIAGELLIELGYINSKNIDIVSDSV